MARLYCCFSASPTRMHLEDYVREVQIDILEYDDAVHHEYLIGRVFLDQVLWNAAEVDRVSLFDVCDNDSQGLHHVHSILTEADGGLRMDLDIDGPVKHLLFLHRFLLHPDFARFKRAFLESTVTLFGWESLAVMWLNDGNITEAELGQLGFRKIAGEQLVFRDLTLRTAYSSEHPRGETIENVATAEHHAWVFAQTESLAAQ